MAKQQESTQVIKAGDKVTVDYTGRIEGVVFDTSTGREPLSFTVGAHEVISGFDEAVIGMSVGAKKTISIPPEKGYGPHVGKMVVVVPRQVLKISGELKEGVRLEMTLPDGTNRLLSIVKIDGDAVTIDLNHPLAGKTLEFDFEIKSIESQTNV